MTPEQIPPELKTILDRAAGREHGTSGPVMTALAEILTEWDRIRGIPEPETCDHIWRDAGDGAGIICMRCGERDW